MKLAVAGLMAMGFAGGLAGCAESGPPEDNANDGPQKETSVAAEVPEADGAGQDATTTEPAAKSDENAVTCEYPVKADDTANTLVQRLESAASREDIHIGEGFFIPGVVLWGDDPARRIEVVFAEEDGSGTATYLEFADGAKWTVGGIAIGDSAARVQQLNGAAFGFYGFEWDYGGSLIDMGAGSLRDLGGCAPRLSLAYDYEEVTLADDFIGDQAVSSDAEGLPVDTLEVNRLGIVF